MVRRLTRKSRANAAFPRRGHDHGRCVSDALTAAAALCAREGERLTPLRKRVLEFVWSSHQPIGAYAILDRLRTENGRAVGPPTVYRALEFLVERGLVHRLASLNAFVGCAQPGDAHIVQFLICRQCGTAAELDDARVAGALDRRAAALGFRVQDQVIELSGLCSQCQNEPPNAGAHADGE
ncbi:MAG TPA: Fur family transcriptional regulator [Alphaproteobacteria bacterium]|nr:Fur family transcriptional regulator [Alphaproteobacteria bacterium]